MNMSDAEQQMFHRYVQMGTRYLEFGAGASTVFAALTPNLEKAVTVESSLGFVEENLLVHDAVANAVKSNKLQFHMVNIGEIAEWGYPKDETSKHLWPNYSLSVFNNHSDFDTILVDGRFRVACALAAIISTPQNAVICFHDFWNRPEYHIVLRYLDVKEQVESLGVFTKKLDIDRTEVQMILQQYLYLPER